MTGRYAVNLPLELKRDAEALAKQQGVSLSSSCGQLRRKSAR